MLYCKSMPFTLRKATFCVLICHLSCCKKASFVLPYVVFCMMICVFFVCRMSCSVCPASRVVCFGRYLRP